MLGNLSVSTTRFSPSYSRTRSHCKTTHGPERRRAYPLIIAKAVVGIDLGTSNSAIAAIRDGAARVIAGVDGAVTPSCVAILQVCQKRSWVEENHNNKFIEAEVIVCLPSLHLCLWHGSVQDKVLVGEAARRQAILNPLNTFASVKRLVGRQYEQVQDELHRASFEGRKSADGGVALWCQSRSAAWLAFCAAWLPSYH